MGGPLLVILADINRVRSENAVVHSLNPSFLKWFIYDNYTKCNKNSEDILFKNLNSSHPNISLTIEVSPKKLLDTKVVLNKDGTVTTFVYRKEKNFQYCGYQNHLNVINEIP